MNTAGWVGASDRILNSHPIDSDSVTGCLTKGYEPLLERPGPCSEYYIVIPNQWLTWTYTEYRSLSCGVASTREWLKGRDFVGMAVRQDENQFGRVSHLGRTLRESSMG